MSALVQRDTTGLRGLLTQLGQAIDDTLFLATNIERDQVDRPLREHFAALRLQLDDRSPTLVLVALDDECRQAIHAHPCDVEAEPCDGIEPPLGEPPARSTNGVEHRGSERLGLSPPVVHGPVFGARVSHNAGASLGRCEVQAVHAPEGTKVLAVATPLRLTQDPALASYLWCQSNFLVVAGATTSEFDATTMSAVRELASEMQAVCRISVGPEPTLNRAQDNRLRVSRITNTLSLSFPTDGQVPASVPTLIGIDSDFRACVCACHVAQRLESSLDMIEERLESDQRHATLRKILLATVGGVADGLDGKLQLSDDLRHLIEIEFGRIETELAENLRQRTLPISANANRVRNLMEDLVDSDLSQDEVGDVLLVKLSDRFLKKTIGFLRDLVRHDLRNDLALVRDRVNTICRQVASTLPDDSQSILKVLQALPAQHRVEPPLIDMVHIEPDFEWEMPRRHLIDRLRYGRGFAFSVLMTLSLVGATFGARTGLRQWFYPCLSVIFLAAVLWTFWYFPRQWRATVALRLRRLRNALGKEVRSAYQSVTREWQSTLARHVRELKGEVERHVKRRAELLTTQVRERGDMRRKDHQEKLKYIDYFSRDRHMLMQQFRRLQQTASEIRASLAVALDDQLRRLSEDRGHQ